MTSRTPSPNLRRHRMTRPRGRSRGIALLLVLAILALVLAMVLAFTVSQGTTLGINHNITRHAQARHVAESGLTATVQYILDDAQHNWRTVKPNGVWVSDQVIAAGTFSVTVEDGEDLDGDGVVNGDGDLADDKSDPVTIVSTGTFEGVTHTVRVVLRGINDPDQFLERIAHWALDEDSGTLASDAVGELDGVYRHGVTLGAAGALSSSTGAQFDGVDDRVDIGPDDDLSVTGDFALSGYIKLTSLPDPGKTEPIFVVEADPAGDGNTAMVELLVDSNGDILYRHVFDTDTGATTGRLFNKTDLELDEWYLIVVHHDAAERQVKLHTRGQRLNKSTPWKYDSGEGPDIEGDATLIIGGYGDAGTRTGAFHGAMDELALFDRDLSDGEIDQLKEEPAFLSAVSIEEFVWVE